MITHADQVQKLEQHVKTFDRRPWDELPTVRELARRFKISQLSIVEMAEESQSLDILVAMKCGNGISEFRLGERRIEWIGD